MTADEERREGQSRQKLSYKDHVRCSGSSPYGRAALSRPDHSTPRHAALGGHVQREDLGRLRAGAGHHVGRQHRRKPESGQVSRGTCQPGDGGNEEAGAQRPQQVRRLDFYGPHNRGPKHTKPRWTELLADTDKPTTPARKLISLSLIARAARTQGWAEWKACCPAGLRACGTDHRLAKLMAAALQDGQPRGHLSGPCPQTRHAQHTLQCRN